MFDMLGNLKPAISKDEIAKLLCTSPETLETFEAAYAKYALSKESDDFFEMNSRQAAEEKHSVEELAATNGMVDTHEEIRKLQRRIVDELLAQTQTFVYDGKQAKSFTPKALSAGTKFVDNSEINSLPEGLRPQLAGNLMKVDITEPSYPQILYFYKRFKSSKNKKFYNLFRQGMDILDLDPVTYEIIGMNLNSMGHWLPQLINACSGQDFFKIPATVIAKVPMPLLQLTRQEYMSMTQTTLDIINEWAHEAFLLNDEKGYFIKTGTYSSKFDFRNAYVHGTKEVRELGEYLLYIHYQALQMAGPLCKPCIYGVSTTNEWVVREFIPDKENNPCIYKGLPLHTEYRIFVDCDVDRVIGIMPYWEPETMKKRFGHSEDSDSPHQIHDYVIYKMHENVLMGRYQENKERVRSHIESILPDLDLHGQWSIDIMQNGEEFWLIDMAIAENSAFYECVPKKLRNPRQENWIPKLSNLTSSHD